MDLLSALVLGLVEGVTEFLPISSTGHLIVASDWLGLEQSAVTTAFEVIIQLAAILAVIARYRDRFARRHLALWLKLLVAFLPFAAVGFLLRHQVKAWFAVEIVAAMFILGGIVFLVLERFYREDRAHTDDVEAVGYRQAFWIGLAQIAALVPGTSRAGATIVGALLVGLSRRAAAEFSFLLALPVMLAASGYDLVRHYEDFGREDLAALAVGFATAFVVAYLTMKLLLSFLERHSFVAFGIYRILFGLWLFWWYAA